ncbi:MAG: acyltransferase, partial [Nitrosopumilaceae archaeon]
YYYKSKYYIFNRRVKIGRNFLVFGTLNINGPGWVIIGDNVKIGMYVTPWTQHKDATIRISDGVFMNGTRFACESSIQVGENTILADCRIMDTDFHGIDPNNRDVYKVAPIKIGANVWITIQCVVTKGVSIGIGTTVTPNSVVCSDLPPNTICGGNPAVVIRTI